MQGGSRGVAAAAAVLLISLLTALLLQYNSCNILILSKLGVCKLGALKFHRAEPVLRHSLLWMAPFLSSSGYGSEALSYVTGLVETGQVARLKIMQHGDSEDYRYWNGLPHRTKQLLLELSRKEVMLNESVVICHSEPGAWEPALYQTSACPPLGYRDTLFVIGRTMFETDRLTPEHVRRCNSMDEIWVPSQFNMESFARSGVAADKLVKVAQSVDVDFFNPSRATALQLQKRKKQHVLGPDEETKPFGTKQFVFLSIFKWEVRKGWDVLLRAYLEEFSAGDNVLLYILTNAYHSDSNYGDSIRDFVAKQGIPEPEGGWPLVQVEDSHVEQVDLPRLYKAADAFVLPSRGEGWGRPHVEAMAMELPVIATNWSGTTEYMTDDNSYKIPVASMSRVATGAFRGHLWAEASVPELRKLMRHVVLHTAEAKAKGRQARKDMVSKYSPSVVSRCILQQLVRIQESSL